MSTWLTIGADLTTKNIEFVGLAPSHDEALAQHIRTSLPHVRSFKVGCDPTEMLLWFESIGATKIEARKIVLQIASKLAKQIRNDSSQ